MFGKRSENAEPEFGLTAPATSQVIPIRAGLESGAPAEAAPQSRDDLIDRVIALARPVIASRYSADDVI